MTRQIEYRKLSELRKLPGNPRTIKKKDMDTLKQSVKDNPDYFEARPLILSNRTGELVILAGNQRYEAAKALGMDKVPTMLLDGLTEEREREIIIRDNISNGDWDMDELANAWSDLPLDEWGLEIGALANTDEAEIEEDEAPEADESKPADSELGEVYKLGEHRLMCGDSTDAGSVAILMDGKKADMVFTDPPYGMNLDTDYSSMKSEIFKGGLGGKKYDRGKIDDFHPEMIDAALALGAKETFLWGADYFAEFLPNKNDGSWIVWDKRANGNGDTEEDCSSDRMYGSCFELCWSKTKHKRDIARVKWAGIFGMASQDQSKRLHPTQKPLELCSWFIKRYGKNCDVIVDLFGGSGSTLIACEQLGRKCYMMELDPKYCDVIRKRWWKFKTGSEEGWQEGTE